MRLKVDAVNAMSDNTGKHSHSEVPYMCTAVCNWNGEWTVLAYETIRSMYA